jgi:hypothetical protein
MATARDGARAREHLPPSSNQELTGSGGGACGRIAAHELLLAFRLEDGANYHNLPCSLSWENTTTGQSGQRRSRMGYASIMGRQLVRGQHGKRDVAAHERSPVRRGRRGSRWVKH